MSPRNDSLSAESLRRTEAGALLLDATNGPVFFYETASPNASCSGCGVGLLRQARSDATQSP